MATLGTSLSAGGSDGVDAIRVLIADDEPALRIALADLLAHEDSIRLVGTAGDADEAIELAVSARPDVALVDVKMPAGGGPRAAREIIKVSPATRVIALSAFEDRPTVLEMLRAGAVGYLVKGTAAEEIVDVDHPRHGRRDQPVGRGRERHRPGAHVAASSRGDRA